MKTGRNGTLDLDLVWHSSEARIAFVPPVSIKDRSLHWVLSRSQTYYPEHILVYGRGKAHCSLVMVLALSKLTDWRWGWWRSEHRTESETQERGLRVQVWTGI